MGPEGGFTAHIIDASTAFIQANNASDRTIVIPKNSKLGRIMDYEAEGCYRAFVDESLAVGPLNRAFVDRSITVKPYHTSTANEVNKVKSTASNPFASAYSATPDPKKFTSASGLTVYGSPEEQARLIEVAESYPAIWKSSGPTIDIPEEDWMTIPLKPGAKIDAAKVYPLGREDRDVVDKEFDQLHLEGRMEWTRSSTPHRYPVFVVWKTVHVPGRPPERKGRVVTDIRGLNKITENDAYPMPLQTDITAAVRDCPYISTVDAAAFFHQWPVAKDSRYMLTVVSHRGQEQYNVAPMGSKASPPYVQRQIDKLLREFREFCRAYIDDIVIYSKTFEEHVAHLHQIFRLFDRVRLRLKASKSYLGYPSVILLGQRVDALGLTTTEEKIKAITQLAFPINLQDLETYLGMTGWLRNYIRWFAQKAEPLQTRKTILLKASPVGGKTRKTYTRTTLLHPIDTEIESFEKVQKSFTKPGFLVHFCHIRPLFADLDASKQSFGAMVYHVKGDNTDGIPRKSLVEPILFLSKLLTSAESRYWPTELEIAAMVWMVRRIRHMIEACTRPVIIYTDHASSTSIAVQTTLKTSNVDNLNTRLVRASQYLSQFKIEVRHKPGTSNVVPDAISRLPIVGQKVSVATESLRGTEIETLDVHAFYLSLVEMSN